MDLVNINSLLPKELLDTLLGLLPPRDLKSAVLVCKLWRKIGEGPHFWKWVNLRVTCQSNLEEMPNIIGLSRLAEVETITLRVRVVSLKVMLAIQKHKGLKVMKMEACNVEEMKSLADTISTLERVELNECNVTMTKEQMKTLLELLGAKSKLSRIVDQVGRFDPPSSPHVLQEFAALNKQSKLKSLNINECDLSSVAAETMAKVVSNLEEATVRKCKLTTEHWIAIFKETAGTNSKVKVLNITDYSSTFISKVDANIIAKAVNNVEKAYFDSKILKPEKCLAIFELAAAGFSKLKVLAITFSDLSSVRPRVLAKVVANMEKINLISTKLTNQQCNAIFKDLADNSKLKVLEIDGNDLSAVEADAMAKTVRKIEECFLSGTKLTTHQLEEIFKLINEDCKLKKLDISYVNLSSVGDHVLSMAIANLEEVNLYGTHLTTQQLEAIFMAISSGSKLKKINLRGQDLQSVQVDCLVEALSYLKVVYLSGASLTPDQRVAIKAIPNVEL